MIELEIMKLREAKRDREKEITNLTVKSCVGCSESFCHSEQNDK